MQAVLYLSLVAGLLRVSEPAMAALMPQESGSGEIRVALVNRDGSPVADALVQLLGPRRTALREARSDDAGRVSLQAVPYGHYELRVSGPIYSDAFRLLELDESVMQVEITLRPTGIEARVTVTASRGALQTEREVPATIRSLQILELQTRAVDLLPRMLDEEPGILTQQTTPGQGSPILRGQSAQSVLYLVDGIRYNNATYRAGNTQYLAWIPDVAAESVETLLGPAAVGYGSDALGGAINVLSAAVPEYEDQGTRWHGRFRLFGESASLGAGLNATVGLGSRRVAGYVASSGARHQDVRGGGARDSHHAAVRFLGLSDAAIRQQFGSRYVDTAYSQAALAAKATLRTSDTSSLSAYYIGSSQYDIRRYDRLLGGDGRVLAEFAPQRLDFGYLRYEKSFSDTFLSSTLSVNRQADGRTDQRRPASPIVEETTVVTAFGFETSLSRDLRPHLLTAGLEIYDEHVNSERFEARGASTEQARPRFPNGARYTSFGFFLLDDFQALAQRLNVSVGARYSAFRYAVRAADNLIGGMPVVPDATSTFDDLTFNLGASFALNPTVTVWGRAARGFRAPSVFDLGSLGLTGGGFEVSPEEAVGFLALIGNSSGRNATSTGTRWEALDPETLFSYEAGIRWFSSGFRFEITGFDSEFRQAISRRVLLIERPVVGEHIGGQEILAQDDQGRIFVEADADPVVSRANIGALRVRGLELLGQKAWGDTWLATLKGSLQRGWELDTGFFARKIAPDNLTAIVRWRSARGSFWLEAVVRTATTQTRFNPGDIEDTRIGAFRDADDITDFFVNQGPRLGLVQDGVLIATGETLDQVIARVLGPGGNGAALFTNTPGWLTLGLRGAWVPAPGQLLSFGLSNLTDTNYRLHGSGFDGLGISANVSYSVDF